MKNKLVIYAKLLKDKLTENGCTFIIQKSEPVSRSIILQFHRNNVTEESVHKITDALKCINMTEIGRDTITILIQEDI